MEIEHRSIRTRLTLAEKMEHAAVALDLCPAVGYVSAKLIGPATEPRRIVCRSTGVREYHARETRKAAAAPELVYVKRYLGRNAKVRGIQGVAWLW